MKKLYTIETWDKDEFEYLKEKIIECGYLWNWEHYPSEKNIYILNFWR